LISVVYLINYQYEQSKRRKNSLSQAARQQVENATTNTTGTKKESYSELKNRKRQNQVQKQSSGDSNENDNANEDSKTDVANMKKSERRKVYKAQEAKEAEERNASLRHSSENSNNAGSEQKKTAMQLQEERLLALPQWKDSSAKKKLEHFDSYKVKLEQTEDYCMHEGNYGHNPEYRRTHELRYTEKAADGKTDKVVTIWKIHTSGEGYVPKEVSATEVIGKRHTCKIQKNNTEVLVEIEHGESGVKEKAVLNVKKLYEEYLRCPGQTGPMPTPKTLEYEFMEK